VVRAMGFVFWACPVELLSTNADVPCHLVVCMLCPQVSARHAHPL
jgi:hypothetical protein